MLSTPRSQSLRTSGSITPNLQVQRSPTSQVRKRASSPSMEPLLSARPTRTSSKCSPRSLTPQCWCVMKTLRLLITRWRSVAGCSTCVRRPPCIAMCICLFMAPIKPTMHRQHFAQLRHSLQRRSQMRLFGRASALSNFQDVSKLWVCNHLSSLMEPTILQVQIVRWACISTIFGPRTAESSSWAPFATLMK